MGVLHGERDVCAVPGKDDLSDRYTALQGRLIPFSLYMEGSVSRGLYIVLSILVDSTVGNRGF